MGKDGQEPRTPGNLDEGLTHDLEAPEIGRGLMAENLEDTENTAGIPDQENLTLGTVGEASNLATRTDSRKEIPRQGGFGKRLRRDHREAFSIPAESGSSLGRR